MRYPWKILFRAVLLAAIGLHAASCTAWRPDFRAPIAPFETPPANLDDLAERMAMRHPAVETLRGRFGVVVQGEGIRGKERFTLLMLFSTPDQVKLGAEGGAFIGSVLQLTQNRNEVGVFLPRDGIYFLGTLDELRAYPRAFAGTMPMDLVRALLVNEEATHLLRNWKTGSEIRDLPDHWVLSVPQPGYEEVFAIRRADGLVQEAAIYDEFSFLRTRITYRSYDWFGNRLFPTEFDLMHSDSGVLMRVRAERIDADAQLPGRPFALTPPAPDTPIYPLRDWLEQIEAQQKAIENR